MLFLGRDVHSVFAKDSHFARAVVTGCARGVRVVVKLEQDLKLRTSFDRLANRLLRRQIHAGRAQVFVRGVEQRRLASFLARSRQTLGRVFRGLHPNGVDGNRIEISDRDDFGRISGSNLLIDGHTI